MCNEFNKLCCSDFRQNKGTILKASVDYIRDLKKDQMRMREMEDKMKEQERQNRMIMLRLQVSDRYSQLKSTLSSEFAHIIKWTLLGETSQRIPRLVCVKMRISTSNPCTKYQLLGSSRFSSVYSSVAFSSKQAFSWSRCSVQTSWF